MKTISIALFLVLLYTGHARTRTYNFDVKTKHVPLSKALPQHTIIHNEWPKHSRNLPRHVTIATADEDTQVLMSKPIHIIQGEELEVILTNSLDTSGMSVHWHGFEMKDFLHYDGVVGITQCALPPRDTMTYKFTVNETPGTYFYHSHSGSLGINAVNKIKAPLIVHPDTRESRDLLDAMEAKHEVSKNSYDALSFYGNERVLFFSDGFIMSNQQQMLLQVGGLNPPVSKNEDGFTVGSFQYEYGTINGKLREVVPVVAGQSYKFRLLNGGSLFAFRISIDGIPMKIVAADSEPVKPFEVDEVILHSAERFDVEITIPSNIPTNSSIWIRADTMESEEQGYQNGVRGILHVVESVGDQADSFDASVGDPEEDIAVAPTKSGARRTMNCNSWKQRDSKGDKCHEISELVATNKETLDTRSSDQLEAHFVDQKLEAHFVDFSFYPFPQFSHFTRIDGGHWYQHVNPIGSHFLDVNKKLHEHTAMLNLEPFRTYLLVWRNKSLMDHPMHLHGYKMEILDTYYPRREIDCSRSDCELTGKYTEDRLKELSANKTLGSAVTKDTFILPAGGAVVTRIQTLGPSIWFAHCHIDSHKEDGMAFILNVGDFASNGYGLPLPDDFPSCDAPFNEELRDFPACDCFEDKDAVLDRTLTNDYKCSRDYLCLHTHSHVANLETYPKQAGISMRSNYKLRPYAIFLIVSAIICIFTFAVWLYKRILYKKKHQNGQIEGVVDETFLRNIGKKSGPRYMIDNKKGLEYFKTLGFFKMIRVLIASQFKEYRPGCVNLLRVLEVTLLGALVGALFYDVGSNPTATALSQKTGLLFFSVTLWTFTRMYPAVGRTNVWFQLAIDFSTSFKDKRDRFTYSFSLWFARCTAAFACEAWWPFLHVFVAYPLAGMFGRIDACFWIAFFLMMNNMCYISIGSLLGVVAPNVSLGMIISTVVSQTSLLAAGFYTTLPSALKLVRDISPVYWTYRGILKTSFRSSDTYTCSRGGQSDVGVNQCFIEQNSGVDILKSRGIKFATSNDPDSESIWKEVLVLLALYIVLNLVVLAVLLIKSFSQKEGHNGSQFRREIELASQLQDPTRQHYSPRLVRRSSYNNVAYLSEVQDTTHFQSAAANDTSTSSPGSTSPALHQSQKSTVSISTGDASEFGGLVFLEDSLSVNDLRRTEYVQTEESDSYSTPSGPSISSSRVAKSCDLDDLEIYDA